MADAIVACEGFDLFGPTNILTGGGAPTFLGEWTTAGGTIVAPLSTLGQAAQFGNNLSWGGVLQRTLTRVVFMIWFRNDTTSASTAPYIQFSNAGTAGFSVTCNGSTGLVALRTGGNTGTIVNSGGAVIVNTVHVITGDVTLGTSGAYSIYLDGVLLFSGTGNTANGIASYASVSCGNASLGGTSTIDNMVVLDPTQSDYDSAFLTANAVVESQLAIADNQTQFTNDGNVLVPSGMPGKGIYYSVTSANNYSVPANNIYLVRAISDVNCTLQSLSMSCKTTSATAKIRMLLYSDNAGNPGSLLSQGNEVVGFSNPLIGTFPTPPTLTASTPVWIGVMTDTAFNTQTVDTTTLIGQRKANTYASGAPAGPLTGMTTGQIVGQIWGTCTGATQNFASSNLNPPSTTVLSQVHSATVGQEDLYEFPALVTTPSKIFGMGVKILASKSDGGARSISVNTKSGATDSTGSSASQSLSTTDQWRASYYGKDPATGAQWTPIGINGAKSGMSVAA